MKTTRRKMERGRTRLHGPLGALVALAILLGAALPAAAHPGDESRIYHYLWLEIDGAEVSLQHATIVGGLITPVVWPMLDLDGDKQLSDAEQEQAARELAAKVSLEVDGKPVPWELDRYEFPSHAQFFAGGLTPTKLLLLARLPAGGANNHTLRLRDDTFPRFTAVFPRPAVRAPGLKVGELRISDDGRITDIPFGNSGGGRTHHRDTEDTEKGNPRLDGSSPRLNTPGLRLDPSLPTPGADRSLFPTPNAQRPTPDPLSGIDPNKAPLFPDRGGIVYTSPGGDDGESARLKGFLDRPLTPALILLGLGTALLLGAAHALEPGHGKSMVAAYLVGSRGTVWDAVLLGITVTITHTVGVYVLGFLCLWLTSRIEAEVVSRWLSIVSGLLVLGMGFWLFQRGLLWYHGILPRDEGGAKDEGGRMKAEGGVHGHTHGGGHSHWHGHSHTHAHANPAAAGAGDSTFRRPPSDSPREDPPQDPERDAEAAPYSRWGVIALGIAGGIVPCPAALAVLIAAVNLQRVLFGLAVIAAFSVGMALTLIALGVVMVTAKDFVRARLAGGEESRIVRALPAVSGGVLLLLGAYLTLMSLDKVGLVGFR